MMFMAEKVLVHFVLGIILRLLFGGYKAAISNPCDPKKFALESY